jgi:protein FAM32A
MSRSIQGRIMADFPCRKKKKKSHSSSDRAKADSEVKQSEKRDKGKGKEDKADEGEIVIKNAAPGEGRKMTESERKFEEVQRLRVSTIAGPKFYPAKPDQREERAKKTATQSHKDRVAEYNAKLERLSEHHDMPKVIFANFSMN